MLNSIKNKIIERAAQIVAGHILKDYQKEIKPLPDFNPPNYKPIHLEPPVTVMYGIQQAPYTAMDEVETSVHALLNKERL